MYFFIIFLLFSNICAMEIPQTDIAQLAHEVEQLYRRGDNIGAIKKLSEQPAALMRYLIQNNDQQMLDLVNHLLDYNFAHDLTYELTEQDYKEMGKFPKALGDKLKLSQRLLTKIAKHLPLNITDLSLDRNQLQDLPANVLPENLAILDVSRNKIKKISLGSLRRLRSLNVRQNDIASLKNNSLPHSLTSLNLSYNRMHQQPDLSMLPGLTDLDLSNNPLSSFDEKLVPETITTLHLHNFNGLRELIIKQLPNLAEFWASNSQYLKKIVIIHSKIRRVRLINIPVEELNLSHNCLESMICDLYPQSVVSLDLSNNPIAEVLLYNLIRLRNLNLEGTQIPRLVKLYWYSKASGHKLVHDFKERNFNELFNNPISNAVPTTALTLYTMYNIAQAVMAPPCPE